VGVGLISSVGLPGGSTGAAAVSRGTGGGTVALPRVASLETLRRSDHRDHDPDHDRDPDRDHDHDPDRDRDHDHDPDRDHDPDHDRDPDHDPDRDRDHDRDHDPNHDHDRPACLINMIDSLL
jgi:hypothetical protein